MRTQQITKDVKNRCFFLVNNDVKFVTGHRLEEVIEAATASKNVSITAAESGLEAAAAVLPESVHVQI